MADELRIRNKTTGEEFVGSGSVPDGYEVVAPQDSAYQRYFAKPVTKAISRGFEIAGDTGLAPPGSLEGASRTIAETIVPQNEIEAGAMVGTGGAGLAAKGLSRGLSALSRITGGIVGGGAGGAVTNEGALKGAVVGGGGAVAGEGLGAVLPWLFPRVAGGRAAANRQDVTNIGGKLPPALGAPKNATEMWEAAVTAPKRLGQAKEAAVQDLETMLPGGAPSRYKTPGTPPAGVVDPGEWAASAAASAERSKFAQALGPAQIDIPTLGQSMTLREANELLSQRGEVLSGRVPLDPRFKYREPKQAYAALAQDIEGGVEAHGGPDALAKWRTLQDAYKAGRTQIKPFQAGAAYQPGQKEGDAQLNLVQVASWMRNPKNAAWMIDRIGRDRYDELVGQITRGAGPLATDVMEPGLGRMSDAARQSLGRGTNTGSLQTIGVPLRTLIPGVGRQYAGQEPYALPQKLQAILDVVMQKAGGSAISGDRR